jgi:serine phosphatase RsbU (regulator of sigma subunit)
MVRDKMVVELKSDFASVGTSKKLFKKPFSQQTIQLKPGDWIYLFSDGYMDQIGGDLKKKFMRSNFIETLVQLSSKTGQSQNNELDQIFTSWKGNNEQIDDVLILGLKV